MVAAGVQCACKLLSELYEANTQEHGIMIMVVTRGQNDDSFL